VQLKRLKIPHFRGVFCRNELPHKANVNERGIINLDDSRGDGALTGVADSNVNAIQILLRQFWPAAAKRNSSISEDWNIIFY
jgi:hypothetical protein